MRNRRSISTLILCAALTFLCALTIPDQSQAVITIETSYINYAGNGTVGPFSFPFKAWEETDIKCYKATSSGVQTTLIKDVDYTISLNAGVGGTITLTSVLPTGYTLTIKSDIPQTQETDYIEGDAFPADSHEQDIDRLTRLLQEVSEIQNRTPHFRESIGSALRNMLLPDPASGGYVLGWNNAGTGMANYAMTDGTPDIDGIAFCSTEAEVRAALLSGDIYIVVPIASYTLTSNLTIPTGKIYGPVPGAFVTVNGFILEFQEGATIAAGVYKIFEGAVTGLDYAFSEWFGAAKNDELVDNGIPWNYAIESLRSHGEIYALAGSYYLVTPILVDAKPITIHGASTYGTVFMPGVGFPSWSAMMTVNSTVRGTPANWWTVTHENGFTLRNVTFEGGGRDYECHGLVFTGKNSDTQLYDIFFSNIKGSGMKACDPFGTTYDDAVTGNLMQQCQFHNVRFQNCGYEATGGTASQNFAASHAAYEIGRNEIGSGSHNHLKHTGAFQMGYSRWRGIRVLNRRTADISASPNIHELTFQDLFLHGTEGLSGNDENGDAWNTLQHLMTIGNIPTDGESSSDTNYNTGEIKTIFVDRFHLVEMEENYAGMVVGECWDGAGDDIGASVHLDHGQFGGGTYLAPSYGVIFDGAESSYVGGITYHSPGGPANSIYVRSLLDSKQEITLGPMSAEWPTGTPAFSATKYIKTDIGQDQIHDLTAIIHTARVADTLAAGTITEFTVARNTPDYRFIKRAWIVPDGTLTANDTNYATLSISYRNNLGGHSTGSPVETTTQTIGSSGTGDWDDFEFIELNCDRGVAYLPEDGAITFKITKAAAGVVTPTFLFGFETSDWKYFQDPPP